MLRVVLDANIFVSAFIQPAGTPGQIIQSLLRDSARELVLTEAHHRRGARGLSYPKVQKASRSKVDPALWFDDLVVLAHIVAGDKELRGVSEDPDDDKYLAGAVEGRADFVVTGDVDLLQVREHEGIQVVTPRAFLDRLIE